MGIRTLDGLPVTEFTGNPVYDEAGRLTLAYKPRGPGKGSLEREDFRALRHLGELLCVIQPTVDSPDDILFGRDPVREERLQERVAVDRSPAARASASGVAGRPVSSPTTSGRGGGR
jgi:hypothetical protein